MRHDKRKSPKRKVLFANGGREGRNWPRQNTAHSCHSSARRDGVRKILPVLHSTGRLLNLYDCIFKEASQDGKLPKCTIYMSHVPLSDFCAMHMSDISIFMPHSPDLFHDATDGTGHSFSTRKIHREGIPTSHPVLFVIIT